MAKISRNQEYFRMFLKKLILLGVIIFKYDNLNNMVSEKIKQFAVKLSFFVVSLLLVAVGVLLMRQKDSQEKLDEFSAAQENKNMMTAKTQTQAQISNSNNAAVPAAAAGTKVS